MEERMSWYEVTFHVATPTMSSHASYEVAAESADNAIAVAKRRAARDHIPTLTAEVTVECLGEYYEEER